MSKFVIASIDFPWNHKTYSDAGAGRSPDAHYKTLAIEDTTRIQRGLLDITTQNAVYLWWVYNPLKIDFASIVKGWEQELGVMYKSTVFQWVKPSPARDVHTASFMYPSVRDESFWKLGLGYYSRQNAEEVWLLRRNDFEPVERLDGGVSQIICEPAGKHSQKPFEYHARIERMFGDVPKIELFARPPFRDGWTVLGNEVDGKDIFQALSDIKSEVSHES